MNQKKYLFLFGLLLIFLAGCTSTTYREEITKLAESSTVKINVSLAKFDYSKDMETPYDFLDSDDGRITIVKDLLLELQNLEEINANKVNRSDFEESLFVSLEDRDHLMQVEIFIDPDNFNFYLPVEDKFFGASEKAKLYIKEIIGKN